MKLKQILLCSLIVMCCAPLGAQTSKEEMFATPEKTGGVYWTYPLDFAPQTKAPKGYKPFISVITDGMALVILLQIVIING